MEAPAVFNVNNAMVAYSNIFMVKVSHLPVPWPGRLQSDAEVDANPEIKKRVEEGLKVAEKNEKTY